MKVCNICLKEKHLSEFHFVNKNRGYRASRCKECQNAYNRSQKEKHREYSRRYRLRHPERRKEITQTWYRNNRSTKHAWTNSRRKRLKAAMPPWFESDLVSEVYRQAQKWGFEVDHIVPITSDKVCGLHCWDNLQLLDKDLNLKKRNQV